MFNLFKNKQREEFDKDYYQFVDKFSQLVRQSKSELIQNNEETFVETIDRHISEFEKLSKQLDDLNLKIESNLKAQTTEQTIEKMQLLHQIDQAQIALMDSIVHFKSLKNAYLQGLKDGYNLERD